MMKLKTIIIEGIHHVLEKRYDFNDVSYLYGPNGAGKSTALTAIQLALLGYIPGTNKKNADIFRHARGKSMSATAILETETGKRVQIVRTWSGAGSSTVKSSVEVIPEGYDIESIISELELPIFNFDEFMSLSANKMKEWFIAYLPNSGDEIDWKAELNDAVEGINIIDGMLINDTLKDIHEIIEKENKTGVELVQAVNAKLKEQLSFENGQLKRTESTIQSLVFYDDCEDNIDLDALRSEVNDAAELRSRLAAYNASVSANSTLQDMLDEIKVNAQTAEEDPEYIAAMKEHDDLIAKSEECITESNKLKEEANALSAEADEISNEASKLQKQYQELSAKHTELNAEMRSKAEITGRDGTCPYTKQVCQSVKDMFAEIDAEVRQMITQLNEIASEMGTVKSQYDEKASEINLKRSAASSNLRESEQRILESNECRRNAAEASRRAQSVCDKYAKRADLQVKLAGNVISSVPPTSKTDAQLANEIEELNVKIGHAEANKRYNELADNLTKEKFKIENTIQVIKIWIKLTDANGMQTTIMEKPFEDLAASMDQYLHLMFGNDEISAQFYLSEKANSFSFGIIRDKKYISFDLLSTGEQCLYTVALMMCLTARSQSPLKLILIDDILDHLDNKNCEGFFKSLCNVTGIQLIIAGVKECTIEEAENIVINVER